MATKEERLRFGFSTEFLKETPEVRKLIDRAIENEWTPERFSDALKGTDWWKEKSDAQRRFDLLQVENPGQVERQLQDARNAIRRMAMRLGVALDRGEISGIARNWVRNELSEDAVRNLVGRKYSPGRRRPNVYDRENLGIAGRARAQVSAMARNYGFVLSGRRANEFARNIARGVRSVEDYEGYFKERAIDLFPTIAADIREGRTVRDILEPYMQIASQELGINPATMNTTASKWLKPLAKRMKNGEERRMTNDEWVRELRTNSRYGFDRTQAGQQVAAQLTMGLEEAFGRR